MDTHKLYLVSSSSNRENSPSVNICTGSFPQDITFTERKTEVIGSPLDDLHLDMDAFKNTSTDTPFGDDFNEDDNIDDLFNSRNFGSNGVFTSDIENITFESMLESHTVPSTVRVTRASRESMDSIPEEDCLDPFRGNGQSDKLSFSSQQSPLGPETMDPWSLPSSKEIDQSPNSISLTLSGDNVSDLIKDDVFASSKEVSNESQEYSTDSFAVKEGEATLTRYRPLPTDLQLEPWYLGEQEECSSQIPEEPAESNIIEKEIKACVGDESRDQDCSFEIEKNSEEKTMEKTNLNKNMEKSFEDLLVGLEDEDDDIDDILSPSSLPKMVSDASFMALADQNYKSGKQLEEEGKFQKMASIGDESYNDENKSEIFDEQNTEIASAVHDVYDFENRFSNAKNEEDVVSEEETPVELKRDESFEQEEEESTQEVEQEEVETSVAMIVSDYDKENDTQTMENHKNLQKADSLDFAAVEDTSYLDVNIGKDKTNLRKKGSLARRKKPTRENVRSLLSSSEDSLFKDTTGAKTEQEMNGDAENNGEEVFDNDLGPRSPPAKKPLSSMPLPGLTSNRPMPAVRKTPAKSSVTSEEEQGSAPKRDKQEYTKNVGVKLPMPVLKPSRQDVNSSSKDDQEESNFTFDKPALKKVDKTEATSKKDTENIYEKPLLKHVEKMETSPKSQEAEQTFEVPHLKTVSRDNLEEKASVSSEHEFVVPSLRTVEKTYELKKSDSIEDTGSTFNMPALKNTPVKNKERSRSPDSKGRFDMPALRRTPKIAREKSTEKDVAQRNSGSFDIPSLKLVSKPSVDIDNDPFDQTGDDSRHKFDVPQLRNVAMSPRSVESNDSEESHSGEKPAWLSDMKLRKTTSVSTEKLVESEKPSWLKTASEKREKAKDILAMKGTLKENRSYSEGLIEMPQLRKTPNGLPLQETTDNNEQQVQPSRSSRLFDAKEDPKPAFRERSSSKETHGYVPSWNNQQKFIPDENTESIPLWKKELAERRRQRKDSDTPALTPKVKGEAEPTWKQEFGLKKKLHPTPAKESKTVTSEPEWKKQAEEKRQRLMKLLSISESGLLEKSRKLKTEDVKKEKPF